MRAIWNGVCYVEHMGNGIWSGLIFANGTPFMAMPIQHYPKVH